MSHFTVLVTNTQDESHDSQLEPFYEQGELSDYFMEKEIEVAAEDMEKKAREILEDKYVQEKPELKSQYEKYIAEGNFTKACEDWYGGAIDEEGNLYYVSNPNAKWDWYVVGGRWSGYFTKKAGAEGEIGEPGVMTPPVTDETLADVIKVKDIDWEAMDKVEKERRGKLYDEYDAKTNTPFIWSKAEVEALTTLSREDYQNRPISHATHAVLHSGEWYERGEMGWWGIVSNETDEKVWDEKFQSFIDSLDPESEVTIVDCHI